MMSPFRSGYCRQPIIHLQARSFERNRALRAPPCERFELSQEGPLGLQQTTIIPRRPSVCALANMKGTPRNIPRTGARFRRNCLEGFTCSP